MDYGSNIHKLRRLKADADRLATLVQGLSDALSSCVDAETERLASEGRTEPPIPTTVHNHKPGGRSKLAKDPEQAAFIEARLGHMTYTEIADAAAEFFGSDRAVKKSTVHKWHRRQKEKFK